MSRRLRIVVSGLIAQHPRLGGVAWDYVQYPAGLARAGHDVYYFEDSGEWPYRLAPAVGEDYVAPDCRENVEHLRRVMSRFGLADRWAYRHAPESRWYGLDGARRREVLASADLLINVSGSLERPERYRQVERLAYVDSDPGFTQVHYALDGDGFARRVDAHDVHFSFGERLGPGVPHTGHLWRPTRQPVLLDEWKAAPGHRNAFTTIMNWTSYEPLRFEGEIYGQKDLEFRRFLDLPGRVAPTRLELAMPALRHAGWESGRPPGGSPPAEMLRDNGWRIVDPLRLCADLDGYRQYVCSSRGEWSVAKHGYVQGQSGWFSCRSACYLAAGRPVIVQDTGFSEILPTGAGLLTFRTVEEAADALRRVDADHARHAAAAREVASLFDAGQVLDELVERAFDSSPALG